MDQHSEPTPCQHGVDPTQDPHIKVTIYARFDEEGIHTGLELEAVTGTTHDDVIQLLIQTASRLATEVHVDAVAKRMAEAAEQYTREQTEKGPNL